MKDQSKTDKPTKPTSSSYDHTIHTFLSLFRFFSYILAVLLIQVIPLNTPRTPNLEAYIVIGCVGIYTLVKVFSRFRWNRENFTTYLILGGDTVVCVALLLFTRGLDSGFLLYALVPIATAALLFDMRISLIIAAVISATLVVAHVGLSLISTSVIEFIEVMEGNYLPLLIVYVGFCFLIANITYRTNLNIRRRIELNAVLEERRRMRRELHDDVAQTMSSLNLRAQMLEKSMTENDTEGATKAVEDIRKISKDTCENIRQAIDSLSSTDFQQLIPNLQNLISEFVDRYGFEILLQLPNRISTVSALGNIQLLYIVNEAFTNIRKHAEASTIWLQLENIAHGVKIMVKDNGKGFSLEEYPQSYGGHHGLNIMKERAEAAGGVFSISSSPGEGTEVTVELPGEKVRL
ncbi:ATP-binding protein [Chloroflexota bacterium]